MSRLNELRKNRGANLKAMQEKLEQAESGGYTRDERIWTPAFDEKKERSTAIVRFLPNMDSNGLPILTVKTNSFNGPGGKYYDTSRESIDGEECPIKTYYISMFKKAKLEDDPNLKTKAKTYQPKSKFYSNVLVIKDENAPENEGKVFVYQYGWQIYKMLIDKLKPEFDDIESEDIFDIDTGRNLIIRTVKKNIPDNKNPGKNVPVPNYEKSEFGDVVGLVEVCGSEDKAEEVLESCYKLNEVVKIEIKSFDEVAEKFKKITGVSYDSLTPKGLEDHVNEKTKEFMKEQAENKDEQDDGGDESDDKEDDDDLPFDPDDSSSSDEDDPVARFMKLAGQQQ